MKLRNKARFWLGAIMGLFEILGLGIFGLTLINWSWLTTKVVFMALSISAIVLYNIIAGVLVWDGSKENER